MKITRLTFLAAVVACLLAVAAGCGDNKNADNLNVGVKAPNGPPPGVISKSVPPQAQSQVQQAIQHGQADGAAYAAQQKARGAQQAPK